MSQVYEHGTSPVGLHLEKDAEGTVHWVQRDKHGGATTFPGHPMDSGMTPDELDAHMLTQACQQSAAYNRVREKRWSVRFWRALGF